MGDSLNIQSHAEAVTAVCATLRSDPDNAAARTELNKLTEASALVRLISDRSRTAATARASLLRLMDPPPTRHNSTISPVRAEESHVA